MRSTPWKVQVPLAVIIPPDVRPGDARDAWTYYEHQEKMDLLLLAAWLFEAWREQCFLERGFRIELGARSGGGSGRPSCG